jgi:predicted small secreted protein
MTDKILVFDMDGTIADLYGVDGWLEMLRNEDATPYAVAEPLVEMEMLNTLLDILRGMGWSVVVTTWLAKDATKEYDDAVRKVKKAWLDRMGFKYDEIHLVKYGTTKANCTRHHKGFQVLIDDNDAIRKGWTLGAPIDAKTDLLAKLIEMCV